MCLIAKKNKVELFFYFRLSTKRRAVFIFILNINCLYTIQGLLIFIKKFSNVKMINNNNKCCFFLPFKIYLHYQIHSIFFLP